MQINVNKNLLEKIQTMFYGELPDEKTIKSATVNRCENIEEFAYFVSINATILDHFMHVHPKISDFLDAIQTNAPNFYDLVRRKVQEGKKIENENKLAITFLERMRSIKQVLNKGESEKLEVELLYGLLEELGSMKGANNVQ